MTQTTLTLKYVHLYADDSNETHFKDVAAPMEEADYAPPAPPLYVSRHETAAGMVAVGFPPGWYGDFHPAPKHQWMIVVEGTVEIGASDGGKRTLSVGSVALVTETGSKGHTTRVIGDEQVTIMVTEVT